MDARGQWVGVLVLGWQVGIVVWQVGDVGGKIWLLHCTHYCAGKCNEVGRLKIADVVKL